MAELKTKATRASAAGFLHRIEDPERRADCARIAALMASATGAPATMWGDAIVGFGARHLRYASGREVDWFVVGFSPRKRDISLYLSSCAGPDAALLNQLGRHRTGKACLYIGRLADVDVGILDRLIRTAVAAQAA